MKRLFFSFVFLLLSLVSFAQADKIIGNYYAHLSRNDAKVKVFKYQKGYRMQIYWIKKEFNDDGTQKKDTKNPDQSKRNTPMDKVVLIDKVTYEDGIWKNGRIYDPTSGRSYKVELKLTSGNTLEVKGFIGIFHKSFYWKKI